MSPISLHLSDNRALVTRRHAHKLGAPHREAVRQAVHQLAAGLLLLLLLPLLILLALLIWRVDGAPVLFTHYRVGKDGALFKCMKFRTMRRDAEAVLQRLLETDAAAQEEWCRDQKLTNDPRITPIGDWLRRTSLDELPQLLNVLRGDMALVGPRPITRQELVRYGEARWHYLCVLPGITGLWQVSGRNNLSYGERVALDRRYVEQRSAGLDLSILVRTVAVVLQRDGAR